MNLSKFEDLSKLSKKSENIILNEEKPSPTLYYFPKVTYWKGNMENYKNYYDRDEEEKEMKITLNEEINAKKENEEIKKKKDEEIPGVKKEKTMATRIKLNLEKK